MFHGIEQAVYLLAKTAIPELKPCGYDPEHNNPILMCESWARDSLCVTSQLRIWIAQGIGFSAKHKSVELEFSLQEMRLGDTQAQLDRIDSALTLLRAYWFGSKPAGKYRKFRASM